MAEQVTSLNEKKEWLLSSIDASKSIKKLLNGWRILIKELTVEQHTEYVSLINEVFRWTWFTLEWWIAGFQSMIKTWSD